MSRWTIDELAELSAYALAATSYAGQASGRVRDVPDRRTIRYYTTLGLISPPTEFRARTAYYEAKHVLQLVAIKRLQAQSLPLVRIQQDLAGISEQDLAKIAQIPDSAWTDWRTNLGPLENSDHGRSATPNGSDARQSSGVGQSAAPFWEAAPRADEPAAQGTSTQRSIRVACPEGTLDSAVDRASQCQVRQATVLHFHGIPLDATVLLRQTVNTAAPNTDLDAGHAELRPASLTLVLEGQAHDAGALHPLLERLAQVLLEIQSHVAQEKPPTIAG